MRRGWTLPELVTVLTLIGLLSGLMLPSFAGWADRLAVRRAADETALFYQRARFAAILRSTRVRLELSPDSLKAIYEAVRDSVFIALPGPHAHRVRFNTSRLVLRIYPNGLGVGGSNTKLVFRRGEYAESLTTSRLGRLKRWR
ncbi:MAG: prepilin-type N-terminal cleavage/methylation domain-containing protein [Gemmatimonadetes bacterium]|nr:prepilin-type N-terminal cleavage/methylation domain-containing protein [Gemmatimonadota bacterium]